jgi:hypothetical protein
VLHTRLTVWIALLALAAAGLGVVAWPRDGGRAVRAFTSEQLVANEGLGELRVGVTTLATVLERLGPGLPAALYGDATALEFGYGSGGMTLRFWLGDDCARTVQAMHGTGLRAVRDARRFARAHPECADERLSSIELVAGPSERGTFWRGEATAGVRLRMPRPEALGRLASVPGALDGPLGLPPDPEAALLLRFVDADGLQVTFAPDRSAAAGGDWIVSRLAVVARSP